MGVGDILKTQFVLIKSRVREINLRRDRVFRHLSLVGGGGVKITPQLISAPMIPRNKIPTATTMFFKVKESNEVIQNIA